jgi:hypothetical protein
MGTSSSCCAGARGHVLRPGPGVKVLESIECGARDFVVKPFQADRVLESVGKALA